MSSSGSLDILQSVAYLGLSKTLSPSLEQVIYFVRTVSYGLLASTLALSYSEILFVGTRHLYQKGKLLRYYPLPTERRAFGTWVNTLSFTVPTAIVARYAQKDIARSWGFNLFAMAGYLALYMVIHDAFFYWCHRVLHYAKPLYDYLHATHHEYSYSMHCYIVGYAELLENFIQVGTVWITWTLIAGHNWWYWTLPLSYVVFSTLVGHSGYRSNYYLLVFHPFALPVALVSRGWLLTTGDHQVHHSHRRVNYGLFWRFWDTKYNTYRKCTVWAYDVNFWRTWAAKKDDAERDEQARKWLGRNQVTFHELDWGF